MSILRIHKYPHPVLREPCLPVATQTEAVTRLISDMVETMYACPGAIGLAACQVGIGLRIFVMDMNAKTTRDDLKVLINPVILRQSRNRMVREGCLSFPEYLVNVKRAQRLTVQCLDEHFTPREYEVFNLEAVAVQHEIDHLDGILMIDRVRTLSTDLIRRQPASNESADDPAS
ncbi:MAG: peptide deformylase [Candidatus Melainabacteria bacterium]